MKIIFNETASFKKINLLNNQTMKKDINHIVEKTLESFDGMEQAKANPFLYGKIISRMQEVNDESAIVYRKKLVLRYAIMILLAVSLNAATVFSYLNFHSKKNSVSYQSGISMMEKEYFNTELDQY